jgi:hypothetical protein
VHRAVWDFQEDGYAFTKEPSKIGRAITVRNTNNDTKIIKQLSATTSQKILGVMKNPIGNQQDEIKRLLEKSNHLATKLNLHALTRMEAKLAYESFYLTALRYSLSVTSINQIDLETIQKNMTSTIISAMGFNRNMPREVVFGARMYQGLGLRHLYDLQGSDGIRLLLQELNTPGNSLATVIKIALDIAQLEAGIQQPIMMDNRPLPYIEWGWIPSIRDFLLHINAVITNANDPQPLFRQNDSYLMDSPVIQRLSYKEQILFNRVRIFLQVECLSDITDTTGKYILKAWTRHDVAKPSQSTKRWPKQADAGTEAWSIWKKYLTLAFTNERLKLRLPLGPWIKMNDSREHYAYWDDINENLITKTSEGSWASFQVVKADR